MSDPLNGLPKAMKMPDRDESEDAQLLFPGLASRADGVKIQSIDGQRGEVVFNKPAGGGAFSVDRVRFENLTVLRNGGQKETGWSLSRIDDASRMVTITKRDPEKAGGVLEKEVTFDTLLSWQP